MNQEMPRIGDWVRFRREGRLVIGVVQYVQKVSSWKTWEAITDIGVVSDGSVLEVRRYKEHG